MRPAALSVKDWNGSKLHLLPQFGAGRILKVMVERSETDLIAEVRRLSEQRDILAETVRRVRDALSWADAEHPAIGFDDLWKRIDLATTDTFREPQMQPDFDCEGNRKAAEDLR